MATKVKKQSLSPKTLTCQFKDGALIIPKNLSKTLATEMWDELHNIGKALVSGQAALVMAIYSKWGEDGVMETTGKSNYAMRLVSIGRNTENVRKKFPSFAFSLGQLDALSKAADRPELQIEIARATIEYNYDPLLIESEITGVPVEIIVANRELQNIQRALGKIWDMPDYVHKVKYLVEHYRPSNERRRRSGNPIDTGQGYASIDSPNEEE